MTSTDLVLAVLLQGAPQGGWMGVLAQLAPFILIFIVFWVLLIAPARRRQKAHQKMLDELKKGDRVVTNGGLHGEVSGLEGEVVFLKIADNVKVRVSKSAVAGLQGQTEGDK